MYKNLRLTSLLVALASAAFALMADIPAGYYNSLNGKSGADLKTAAKDIVYNHTQLSYSGLPSSFKKTDLYPNSTRWWDMYSDIPLYSTSFDGLNREHSFPKSWWGGGTDVPAYVDINHLYPAEAVANQKKSNWPLGVVSSASYDNGVSKIGTPSGASGGASTVFEPADEYKGDFARTYFYMVTCYQDLTWASKYMWMLQQNTYPTLAPWAQTLLLQWSRQDPVSQKELDRNEAVYKLQNNRNPFIDYPELAEYIWGNHKDEAFYTNSTPVQEGDPNLITPTQGMTIEFGEVAVGMSQTRQLNFRGENLTGNLELTLSRGNKEMFSLSDTQINTAYVNTEDGYWTTITYSPTATGEHSTKLFITDGGISGSRGIDITGTCLPVPTLTAPVATPATNISANGYTANWQVPAGETIDYYVVTRYRFLNGNSVSEELVAEENSLEIDDMTGNESYSVQSVRLNCRSAASNIITVESTGISGVAADTPAFGTVNVNGGVMFRCPETVHNVAIYDIAGRKIREIPSVTDGQVELLPFGGYIIAAPGLRTPFRILVTE